MPEVMKTVGRYEILREVGRGGMAMVYLARQTDLDRFVALKELGAFHASDPSFAQRFLRESRVAGSLSHPNIVTVHDYFEHDGTPYIAMEYVERGSLRPYVGRMNMAQIGGVLEGLLAGLTHAESHGIVHRDLKPENLMVTADGRVKIADFGIAKATTKMQTGAFLTATGTTVGTPTYMAPEQAMAQDIGPWTDLYSVGCMAFELFTGNVPFHDSDAPMAILLRHVNEPIAPVKSIRPEVDPRISDWIEQLLVKDPTQRTQSAQDAWDEFEEIMLGLLGPRWRREARLVETVEETDGAKPLTPAPFQGTSTGGDASEEFKSFAWGAPAGDTGSAPAPPMWTPPPSESTPSIPEPVVGPPTPMPSQAVPAPAPPAPDPEPVADSGFVTFGQPAPAPPTDALVPPGARAGRVRLPSPSLKSRRPSPSSRGAAKAFETYVAPPPSRPPTSEPALTPAPVEAVAPAPAPPAPEPVAYTPPPAPEPVVVPAPEPAAPVADTMMPSSLPTTPPKPPKEKAPAGESGGRPKWIIPAAIAGGVAVVGVAAALALGGGGGGEDSQPTPPGGGAAQGPAVELASGGIALTVPAGWSDGGEAPQIPGVENATSAGGPKGSAVVFGIADDTAANSTLLAGDLRQVAGEPLPEKTIVDIGDGAQAVRYAKLGIGDDKTATVFAVPTSAGVATLACTADEATCDSIAASMKITDGTTFPAGPSETYQGDVEGILAKLEKAEKTAASRLKSARQRTSQAAATSRLATAYTAAAAALGKLDVSPADAVLNANLAESLGATGTAYKNAAAEARSKDRAGYKRQGGRAVAAGGDVGDSLDGFGTAGYQLDGAVAKNAAAVTRLPTLIKDKPKAKPKSSPLDREPSRSNSSSSRSSSSSSRRSSSRRSSSRRPSSRRPSSRSPSRAAGDSVSGGGEG